MEYARLAGEIGRFRRPLTPAIGPVNPTSIAWALVSLSSLAGTIRDGARGMAHAPYDGIRSFMCAGRGAHFTYMGDRPGRIRSLNLAF